MVGLPLYRRMSESSIRQVELQDAPVCGHLAQVGAEVFRDEFSLKKTH